MADWYWYEKLKNGGIRLLRVFGTSPEVVIPGQILGEPVVELGAYCFAVGSHVTAYETASEDSTGKEADRELEKLLLQERVRELSGKYIQKVELPETVQLLGNFCFYQCTALRELVIGRYLTEIGSDAFMNCLKLKKITVNGSVTGPSGLKQILGQRSLETEVDFINQGRKEAVLVYPEYSETYEEIGPAHIFTLNIEGEGFRARQCFQNGIVDLAGYDAVFLQASAKENVQTLCHMAWMRLYYPKGLREESRKVYEEYLREQEEMAGALLVQEKNLELLFFAGEHAYFSEKIVDICTRLAAQADWTEGAGMLLQNKKRWFGGKKEEYSFDEF